MLKAMDVIVNINVTEFPKCDCGGTILPVQDMMSLNKSYKEDGFEQENTLTYLKGWICLSCKKNVVFRGGNFNEQEVVSTRKI